MSVLMHVHVSVPVAVPTSGLSQTQDFGELSMAPPTGAKERQGAGWTPCGITPYIIQHSQLIGAAAPHCCSLQCQCWQWRGCQKVSFRLGPREAQGDLLGCPNMHRNQRLCCRGVGVGVRVAIRCSVGQGLALASGGSGGVA
jgi:hypothetical protein